MKRRTQQFIAAFVITGIVIGGLCGFVVVDLSTERYMPKEYGPFFLINQINADVIFFSAMGQDYRIDPAQLEGVGETLWRCRGALPTSVTLTGTLTAKGYLALREYWENRTPPEEPW